MSESDLPDEPEQPQEPEERPSRSARKRSAEALQRLGERLLRLRTTQLERLELPPRLLEALLETQRLRSRPAIARGRQYIGRIMREIDPAPIERALSEHAPDLRARDAKIPR
jgi:ribosome-associated protein